MERIPTWRDVPAEGLINLLGPRGDELHPRTICDPELIASFYGIPLDLIPVREILADESRGIVFRTVDGKPARYVQGVVAGDLIDSIAKGFAVKRPANARRGYSGGRLDLAAAIVEHLKAV